jgi:hypothetical protein
VQHNLSELLEWVNRVVIQIFRLLQLQLLQQQVAEAAEVDFIHILWEIVDSVGNRVHRAAVAVRLAQDQLNWQDKQAWPLAVRALILQAHRDSPVDLELAPLVTQVVAEVAQAAPDVVPTNLMQLLE